MMKAIYTALVLLLGSMYGLWAQGGGWTSGHFKGFFKIEERLLVATDFYDKEGTVVPIPNTGILTTSFYGQFGILKKWDVIAYVPLLVYNYQDKGSTALAQVENLEKGSKASLGDLRVGLKYGIIQNKPLVLSVGMQIGLPTDSSPKDAMQRFQVGDRDFNQTLYADLGLSLWPVPAYTSAGLSFRNRNQSLSDDFRWYINGGISLLKVLAVKAEVSGLYSMQNGTKINPDELYGTFLNNTEYLAYGAELSWGLLPKLGLSVGVDLAAGGKNILAAPALYGSLYLDL